MPRQYDGELRWNDAGELCQWGFGGWERIRDDDPRHRTWENHRPPARGSQREQAGQGGGYGYGGGGGGNTYPGYGGGPMSGESSRSKRTGTPTTSREGYPPQSSVSQGRQLDDTRVGGNRPLQASTSGPSQAPALSGMSIRTPRSGNPAPSSSTTGKSTKDRGKSTKDNQSSTRTSSSAKGNGFSLFGSGSGKKGGKGK